MDDAAIRLDRLRGVMLGMAVGDSLGLPREGLSARRAARLFPGPLRHELLPGRRGMCSDDTEHTAMTAQAILRAEGNVDQFRRSLAWRLRGWLIAIPAGIGFATLRSIVRLWLGWSPKNSGVMSAGNGPAMRAPVIGAAYARDLVRRKDFVEASTRMTHRDPRAVRGAELIAHAAATGVASIGDVIDRDRFIAEAMDLAGDDRELLDLLAQLAEHLDQDSTLTVFAAAIGCDASRGVSGFIYQTVPVCLFSWLHAPLDFRRAVTEAIALGGDTDTVGGIVGALAGATLGADAIPREWLNGIIEYPRSVAWLDRVAARLAELPDASAPPPRPVPLAWFGLIPRNVFFGVVVVLHALRRLLPPY